MIRFRLSIVRENQDVVRPPTGFGTVFDETISGFRYVGIASPRETASQWLNVSEAAAEDGGADTIQPEVRLDPRTGTLTVLVPLLTPMHLFLATESDAILLANDLRLLPWKGRPLNERGVYSLLQFGAVAAPFTLWQGIRRVTPGTRLVLAPPRFEAVEKRIDLWSERSASASPSDGRDIDACARDALDEHLRRTCIQDQPIILFSGGVDSGLLAARAAELGWQNTLLVNYSRWDGDPEARLAEAMAQHLGLKLDVVREHPSAWDWALGNVGASYSQPFGDYSTFPSLHLVRHVVEHHGNRRVILDGCGADGVFGAYPKLSRWAALYRIPALLRWGAGRRYPHSKFWLEESRLARRMGWSRISSQMEILLASVIAENPLCGIAFDSSKETRLDVHQAIVSELDQSVPFSDFALRARALDVLHVVRDIMAQGAFPVTLGTALDIDFPFMAPELFRLGFREAARGPAPTESKAELKRLLARQVPSEMVYRPKSSPEPPITEQLQRGSTAAAFHDIVLAPTNVLRPFLNVRTVTEMVRLCGRQHRFPHLTINFLWTLLFASLWLDQAQSEG